MICPSNDTLRPSSTTGKQWQQKVCWRLKFKHLQRCFSNFCCFFCSRICFVRCIWLRHTSTQLYTHTDNPCTNFASKRQHIIHILTIGFVCVPVFIITVVIFLSENYNPQHTVRLLSWQGVVVACDPNDSSAATKICMLSFHFQFAISQRIFIKLYVHVLPILLFYNLCQ